MDWACKDGSKVRFLIRNVRGIPSYKYTLLSTTQMWKEHLQAATAAWPRLPRFVMPKWRLRRSVTLSLLMPGVISRRRAASVLDCRRPPQARLHDGPVHEDVHVHVHVHAMSMCAVPV